MSLGTVFLGWVFVAVLFVLVARLRGPLQRRGVILSLVESLVLTLLAGLWFGTAGHGGWAPVFALVGLLVVMGQVTTRLALAGTSDARNWRGPALELLRYLVAGALLAWRLG